MHYVISVLIIERNIIRGRRAVLGVYPTDPEGEFSERRLEEVTYEIDENHTYYENEAYRTLADWIASQQSYLTESKVSNEIQPLLEAFFSSPWAYVARLKHVQSFDKTVPAEVIKSAERWREDEDEFFHNLADAILNGLLKDRLIEILPSKMIIFISMLPEMKFLTVLWRMRCIHIEECARHLQLSQISSGKDLYIHILLSLMKGN